MSALITVDELLALPAKALDVAAARAARRLVLTERLILEFANRRILLAELQRIMHTEGMSDRAALQAECDVYNSLLPTEGLSAWLTVTPTAADGSLQAALQALTGLEPHLKLALGAQRYAARWDGPLMSQQHVHWPLAAADRRALQSGGTAVPVVLEVDLPNCAARVPMPGPLRHALLEDLT